MEKIAAYSLRPVQEQDEALLLELYASTRADEMALVPWEAAQKQAFVQMQFFAQQKHYRAYFPNATHEVILADGRPVGRLYVDPRETEIRILDITLLPHRRGGGIGTQILRELMKEAEQENKSCSIYVESFNRSLGLFQRLGFVKTEESGASWLMEWRLSP
jgi:ribosomal protein S18 acetylase RimI-like enzyme